MVSTWRAVIVASSIAAPFAVLTGMAGCDLGSPASPTFPVVEASVVICPTLDPTFDSIRTNLLKTDSCGTDRGGNCHSPGIGASNSGGLDYSVDASALYEEFLGATGTGALAQNIAGSTRNLRRVVPGDAGASFLYIKLITHTKADPNYGSGMPQDFPGAVCPSAVTAVQTWIDNGAQFEESDADTDAEPSDAAADADAGLPSDAGGD
jgi:hypothetical protein